MKKYITEDEVDDVFSELIRNKMNEILNWDTGSKIKVLKSNGYEVTEPEPKACEDCGKTSAI